MRLPMRLRPAKKPPPSRRKQEIDKKRGRRKTPRTPLENLPLTSVTVMTDLLIFLTLVFTFTTNSTGSREPAEHLAYQRLSSADSRSAGDFAAPALHLDRGGDRGHDHRVAASSPGAGAQTGGCAATASMRSLFGAAGCSMASIQSWRLMPGLAGTGLDEQLNLIADHFALLHLAGWWSGRSSPPRSTAGTRCATHGHSAGQHAGP